MQGNRNCPMGVGGFGRQLAPTDHTAFPRPTPFEMRIGDLSSIEPEGTSNSRLPASLMARGWLVQRSCCQLNFPRRRDNGRTHAESPQLSEEWTHRSEERRVGKEC